MALHNVLERDDKPAGLIAISTYLAFPMSRAGPMTYRPSWRTEHSIRWSLSPPVRQSAAALEGKGANVEWHDYPNGARRLSGRDPRYS